MADFSYEATDVDGRLQRGRLQAASARDALRALRGQGLVPVDVAEARGTETKRRVRRGRLKRQDQILFLNEMAILLQAGVSLADAIASVAQSEAHPTITTGAGEIERGLKRGETFGRALKLHLPMLPAFVHQLVLAGEMTGELAGALRDGAQQMEYDLRVRQDLRNALVYPAILVTAGVGAVLFIFVVVVPRFAGMLKNRKQPLPWISDVVITTGLFVERNLMVLAGAALLLGIVGAMVLRRPQVRVRALEAAQRVPIIGTWWRESEAARWASVLATMLANKIALMQGLEMARDGLTVPSLKVSMGQVEKAVRGGSALADALASYTEFPQISVNLVRVGERAGNLPEMLRSFAMLGERNARDRMKRFLLVIEPAAILIIGAVIGVIVTAIMLAVTSISNIQI